MTNAGQWTQPEYTTANPSNISTPKTPHIQIQDSSMNRIQTTIQAHPILKHHHPSRHQRIPPHVTTQTLSRSSKTKTRATTVHPSRQRHSTAQIQGGHARFNDASPVPLDASRTTTSTSTITTSHLRRQPRTRNASRTNRQQTTQNTTSTSTPTKPRTLRPLELRFHRPPARREPVFQHHSVEGYPRPQTGATIPERRLWRGGGDVCACGV